jgi:hypothetical protein
MCPLRRATFARRVMFGARVSLVHRATVARRDIFLPLLLSFCRATVARRLVSLRATASFSWGPPFILFVSFGSWLRRSAASFRSLRHFFFGSSTGITVAFSAGTSPCAASGFLSSEVGFPSFIRSSVVSRQAVVCLFWLCPRSSFLIWPVTLCGWLSFLFARLA